LTYTH